MSFLAPPTSCAKDLLAAEPGVAQILYFEHGGSELRRGLNLLRLIALLRRNRFQSIWILDRTVRPAFAAMLAGIPERIGLGLGPQSFFITNPGIGHRSLSRPADRLAGALMAAMNVPLASTEPDLRLPGAVLAATAEKFKSCARPWIVLGIGASHPDKDWPVAHWAEFLSLLRGRASWDSFPRRWTDELRAGAKFHDAKSPRACRQCLRSRLTEAAALLRLADLFVGPSSGPMNLAAAGRTEAFGLFGSTPVLTYSKFIHAVVPPGGPSPAACSGSRRRRCSKPIAPLSFRQRPPRMETRAGIHCRVLALSTARSSTKRMAIGWLAIAPPIPLLKCSGVQRLSAASTASP